MDTFRQATLAQQALSEIEQLLRNYDSCGQIESAMPLLLRQHRTLMKLRDALRPELAKTDRSPARGGRGAVSART